MTSKVFWICEAPLKWCNWGFRLGFFARSWSHAHVRHFFSGANLTRFNQCLYFVNPPIPYFCTSYRHKIIWNFIHFEVCFTHQSKLFNDETFRVYCFGPMFTFSAWVGHIILPWVFFTLLIYARGKVTTWVSEESYKRSIRAAIWYQEVQKNRILFFFLVCSLLDCSGWGYVVANFICIEIEGALTVTVLFYDSRGDYVVYSEIKSLRMSSILGFSGVNVLCFNSRG